MEVGIKLLSQIAAIGLHPNRLVTRVRALTATERKIENQTIQIMPLPSCNRRRDMPTLIFRTAMAKPLTRTAKFEYLRAVVICAWSSRNFVLPYP